MQLKIGTRTYSLSQHDDVEFDSMLQQKGCDDLGVNAFIEYDEQIICLRSRLKLDRKKELIVHEMIHACLEDAGHYQSEDVERFVSALAPRLTCLLNDNNIDDVLRGVIEQEK